MQINGHVAPSQPWNKVIFPAAGAPMGVNATTAKAIPAVSRALHLISGMASQMPMNKVREWETLDRPPILRRPDPGKSRSHFVGMHFQDYLLHGNAVSYVTSWNEFGEPASVMWLPAEQVSVSWNPAMPSLPTFWAGGEQLDGSRVIHIQRGADSFCPHRGIGIIEQHRAALGKVDSQDAYERSVLDSASVPSVAVVVPNRELAQEEADEARRTWMDKYGGPERTPGIFPEGTSIIPLSWSPSDSQLVEARQQSLTDIGNIFNLDAYWLGAPQSSHTYRSPGTMYLNLLRQTVNPILEQFEDVWSHWFISGDAEMRFQRRAVLADDYATSITSASTAVKGGYMTTGEARMLLLDLPADMPDDPNKQPIPPEFLAGNENDDGDNDDNAQSDDVDEESETA